MNILEIYDSHSSFGDGFGFGNETRNGDGNGNGIGFGSKFRNGNGFGNGDRNRIEFGNRTDEELKLSIIYKNIR